MIMLSEDSDQITQMRFLWADANGTDPDGQVQLLTLSKQYSHNLRNHAYSNILKILQSKTNGNFSNEKF